MDSERGWYFEPGYCRREANGVTYLGATTLSKLVSFKNKEFVGEINMNLEDASAEYWAPIYARIPAEKHEQVNGLIGTLTCQLACDWDLRVTAVVEDYPCALTLLVEEETGDVCLRRQKVCADLQSRCKKCLTRKFSDVQ